MQITKEQLKLWSACRDGTRTRFAVAYVGENGIEAGVKYRLNDKHEFEAVK